MGPIVLSTHWRRRRAHAEANEVREDQREAELRGGLSAVLIVNGESIACDDRIAVRRRGRGDFRYDVTAEPR